MAHKRLKKCLVGNPRRAEKARIYLILTKVWSGRSAVQTDMPMTTDEKVAATPLAPRDFGLAAHLDILTNAILLAQAPPAR